jgi:hypothetical protein
VSVGGGHAARRRGQAVVHGASVTPYTRHGANRARPAPR